MLETDEFWLREVVADDLEDVHLVFESNPGFLALRADIGATPGGYDLASVKQYWEMAALDPQRHLLVVADKETDMILGLVDFVDQSPADGMPWIGLVMIHRSHQRRRVGAAALQAVAAYLASQGHSAVRMAVIEGNKAGLGFARSAGFEDYGSAAIPTPSAARRIVLLELALSIRTSG